MSENKQKLIEFCKAKGAKIKGIAHLIEYYQKSLGWSEQAVEYAIKLFEDGTIDSIMVILKEGGNDDDTN